MKIFKPLIIIVAIVLVLGIIIYVAMAKSNFIAEDYDGNPPNAILHLKRNDVDLPKANIHWDIGTEEYKDKKVNDIQKYAEKTKKIDIESGENVGLELAPNGGNFNEKEVKVQVWELNNKDNKETLKVEDGAITLPNIKGERVLEVNLVADEGTVQYISKINLK
jgi:hypothetical protein